MIITHYGAESIKVVFGDTTLAFNPVSKESRLKQTRFGADIVLISLEHPDMNGVDMVTHGEKEPFVIRGPGEYEKNDILVKGYQTTSSYGGIERINTVYLVKIEKMLLLYLGALATDDLPGDLKEALDSIDILLIPIGGDGVLDPADAHEVAVSITPKIIIPLHWSGVGKPNALQQFLKEEGGDSSVAPLEKLTVKAKDIENTENEIVVLGA